MINLIVDSSTLTGDDYIEKTIGHLRCLYYMFLDTFHTRPKDLIDMIDGILYTECKGYIQKQEMDKLERARAQEKK